MENLGDTGRRPKSAWRVGDVAHVGDSPTLSVGAETRPVPAAGRWGFAGACTAAVAGGYGSGVGVSSAVTEVGGLHGFPVMLTRFVGRAGPAGEVAGLLERHRLVTVTGPGGMGKTRLACEVARVVASRFADGA